jgi:hypothetical protein
VPRPQARHPSQHRVDVASQGGCAGPGRVRYRRARRAVRAGWLGAEPRDRERSSGRGLEDFRRRAAAAAAQDPRRVGSSEDHLEASWVDFGFIRSPASAGTGIIRHQMGECLLSRSVSRGPRLGQYQWSYVSGHGHTAGAVIARGGVPPVTSVPATTLPARHAHGGHGPTAGAVIVVTAAGVAPPGCACRTRPGRAGSSGPGPLVPPVKWCPGLIRGEAHVIVVIILSSSRRGLRWPRHSTKTFK